MENQEKFYSKKYLYQRLSLIENHAKKLILQTKSRAKKASPIYIIANKFIYTYGPLFWFLTHGGSFTSA